MSERKRCELCGHFEDKHEPGDRLLEIEDWLRKETKFKAFNRHPVANRLRMNALRAENEIEVGERKALYERELRRLKRKAKK